MQVVTGKMFLSEEFTDSCGDSIEFQFEKCTNDEVIKIVKKT